MATDYDRLFAPAEGGEIPDAAGSEPDFDIDSDFDIDLPATAPPMPTSPFEPNVHAPQPMPVDWNQQPPPARPEALPPMPIGGNGHPHRPGRNPAAPCRLITNGSSSRRRELKFLMRPGDPTLT